jgi:diguanylate cyclase (GGDEF)-like protein
LSGLPCEAEQLRGPIVNAREHKVTNPLAGLPSVLAIRDLRRRIRRCFTGLLDPARALQLLHLDPPTVLRTMRAATSPVYGADPAAVWTIESIARTVGPSVLRRALDVQVVDVTGTTPVRRLWLHSVATAHAARSLAAGTGVLHPDEAYLAGLLHALPTWLELLGRRHDGAPPPGTLAEWLHHWNVPDRLSSLLLESLELRLRGAEHPRPDSPATLLLAAELLADLSDFPLSEAHGQELLGKMLEGVDREQLLAAQKLRREVEGSLREIGLDLALPEPDPDLERSEFQDELDCLTSRSRDETGEVVLSLLGCSRSASYRGIVTASTAAALRHLGFDRATYVKWVRGANRVIVRAKADLSGRRIAVSDVTPTRHETNAFARSVQEDQPTRIHSSWNQGGLLQLIGADEALVVAVNRDFQVPAFVVLDRMLSARSLQLLRESEPVTTLAMTTSLLNENLLLKLRRQRAQKFASTDPLTRLYNRRLGIAKLDQEIARAGRGGQPVTVLMLDLDDFKKLNDQHGHLQGDYALRATAEVLRRTLRKADTICRYGGEEFMVVLPDTAAEDASILAARLYTAVETLGKEIELPTTVSIGLASLRPDDSVESILQRADRALYASKSLGRNRFSVDAELE